MVVMIMSMWEMGTYSISAISSSPMSYPDSFSIFFASANVIRTAFSPSAGILKLPASGYPSSLRIAVRILYCSRSCNWRIMKVTRFSPKERTSW